MTELTDLGIQVMMSGEPFDTYKLGVKTPQLMPFFKPVGLWTSSLVESPYLCDWGEWCASEEFRWPPKYVTFLRFAPCRVERVRTVADIARLSELDGPEWYHRRWLLDGVDAVWGDGRSLHRQSMYNIGETKDELGCGLVANGWDVESTCWLNPTLLRWWCVDTGGLEWWKKPDIVSRWLDGFLRLTNGANVG